MCRSGRFCTLSTAQTQPRPHEALKRAANQAAPSPPAARAGEAQAQHRNIDFEAANLVLLIERRPLSCIANRQQPINKRIVKFYRLGNRGLVRLTKADGLQQFAPDILH
jgi:hypothetical protein